MAEDKPYLHIWNSTINHPTAPSRQQRREHPGRQSRWPLAAPRQQSRSRTNTMENPKTRREEKSQALLLKGKGFPARMDGVLTEPEEPAKGDRDKTGSLWDQPLKVVRAPIQSMKWFRCLSPPQLNRDWHLRVDAYSKKASQCTGLAPVPEESVHWTRGCGGLWKSGDIHIYPKTEQLSPSPPRSPACAWKPTYNPAISTAGFGEHSGSKRLSSMQRLNDYHKGLQNSASCVRVPKKFLPTGADAAWAGWQAARRIADWQTSILQKVTCVCFTQDFIGKICFSITSNTWPPKTQWCPARTEWLNRGDFLTLQMFPSRHQREILEVSYGEKNLLGLSKLHLLRE